MTPGLQQILNPQERNLGDGFRVRRILPAAKRKMIGPFIFFDHFGPVTYPAGRGFDVRPHPHIGLATVTYLYEGAIRHKDTVGSDLTIRPGAVNWMTAGRGITHSERTPDAERAAGQSLHGIQSWVALPEDHMETEPRFVHHPAETLPVLNLGGAEARIIAGTAFGASSPVDYPWPIWYVAGQAETSAAFSIPASEAEERAVYIATGSAKAETSDLQAGQMAILTPGRDVMLELAAGTRFLLAGGARMESPRLIDWNFVATSPDRLAEARKAWTASAQQGWQDTPFTLPEGETDYIPLP